MNVFSSFQGALFIIGYAALMIVVTLFIKKGKMNKEGFLVAHRKVGSWSGAFSIAATWIWAPALFVAAEKAYTQGIAGVFWFTVPNVLCLIIFGYFANNIRSKMPEGFTLSGYVRKRFSARTQQVYGVELVGLSMCCFAVQLLAGGLIISTLMGLPYALTTIILAFIALGYSFLRGLRASIVTDYVQMLFMLIVGAIVIPWAIVAAGGFNVVMAGIGGASGKFTSLFTGAGGSVFWSFGIVVTIGLLSGPFGDQAFWQRAFAVKKNLVKSAFIKGALIFAIVPVTMSLLGFLGAGAGLKIADTQLTNLQVILHFLPVWVAIPFAYMLLSGLVSTLDSVLCAVASIGGHDFTENKGMSNQRIVSIARVTMVGAALGGILIANIPGMKILYLFLFYGTLRASTLLPTVMMLLSTKVRERGVFWGIVTAIVVGLPVFAYGNFAGVLSVKVIGSIFTVLSSGTITYIISKRENAKQKAIL